MQQRTQAAPLAVNAGAREAAVAALARGDLAGTGVAIRRLGQPDREALHAHLAGLDAAARRLRFGGEFDDPRLARYVAGIDFGRDVVLGLYDAAGRLVGIGEMRAAPEVPAVREIAFSVNESMRGRGLGGRLLAVAIEHARRERFTRLHALCAAGNVAMLYLLQRAGFAMKRSGLEVAVSLDLPALAEPIGVGPAARCEAQREVRLDTFIADDGETIRVARVGSGPPVLLLHGFGASHADWRAVAADLAEDHEVFAWHARGHWRSPGRVDDRPTVERLGEDLAQLIEQYRLERPVIVGHSMGALVAMQYLRTRGTANVRAFCVVDQSPRIVTSRGWSLGFYGRFGHRQSERFVAQLRADFGESVLRMLALGLNAKAREEYLLNASHIVRARRALREPDGSALAHLFASLARADFRSLVPTLDCPVLVLLGGKSHLFPTPEHADYWRSALRSARVEIYPGADHFPHRTHAARMVADLRALVASAEQHTGLNGDRLRIGNALPAMLGRRDRTDPRLVA
jgi:pimeloyl-ACP methyl ester carboxylesterase/RimJ/RimL family protein N-acetyltransferase